MSKLVKVDDIYKALSLWDWQDVYLPVHFKELVEELPSVDNAEYTEQDVRDAFGEGFAEGISRGYEDAVRNYRDVLKDMARRQENEAIRRHDAN